MTLIAWITVGLVMLALIVWLGRLVMLGTIGRLVPALHPDMYPDSTDELPSLSILVAAKDEASNIEDCLRSLCEQDYSELQIIAVNDRSTDNTGRLMERLAHNEPRLKICHVHRMKDGWFGKNNAMREGVAHATGRWLCFTDADCVLQSPRSLSIAMRYARAKEADFLSVLPSHQANTFWERVIQPACSGILLQWFNPILVNNPRRKTAYANGAFMLINRSCYEAIGGHAAVKSEINEDIRLAHFTKESGHRLMVVPNRGLYSVRMYGTLHEIWSGWTRIFFGCFRSIWRLLLVAGVLLEFSLVPWITLIGAFLAAAWWGGDGSAPLSLLKWTSLATCVVQLAAMSLFYSLSRIQWFYGLLYPIGALMGMGLVINAIGCNRGFAAFKWRGTTFRNGAIESLGDPITSDSP